MFAFKVHFNDTNDDKCCDNNNVTLSEFWFNIDDVVVVEEISNALPHAFETESKYIQALLKFSNGYETIVSIDSNDLAMLLKFLIAKENSIIAHVTADIPSNSQVESEHANSANMHEVDKRSKQPEQPSLFLIRKKLNTDTEESIRKQAQIDNDWAVKHKNDLAEIAEVATKAQTPIVLKLDDDKPN